MPSSSLALCWQEVNDVGVGVAVLMMHELPFHVTTNVD